MFWIDMIENNKHISNWNDDRNQSLFRLNNTTRSRISRRQEEKKTWMKLVYLFVVNFVGFCCRAQTDNKLEVRGKNRERIDEST